MVLYVSLISAESGACPHLLGSNVIFVSLKCRLKCLHSTLRPCSALTLLGVNGKSQKAALLNRIAADRVGIAGCLPPLNLMLKRCGK